MKERGFSPFAVTPFRGRFLFSSRNVCIEVKAARALGDETNHAVQLGRRQLM